MQIQKIQMNNIGPYIGANVIDLTVTELKNIILIGGKNGAGKTTFLNALRIGLFGSFSFGYRSETAGYYENLSRVLNYREFNKERGFFSIMVNFTLDEEFSTNSYIIDRRWTKSLSNMTESVDIYRNNIKLKNEEKEDLISKLKEIYPPSLIDLTLFDGEKVGQIIENGETSKYLREIFETNFGVNYFEKLSLDLSQYMISEKKNRLLTDDEIELFEIGSKFQASKKELQTNLVQLKNYKLSRKEKIFELREKNKKFKNYGGISVSDKNEIEQFMLNYERNQKIVLFNIKTFLENEILFYLNKNLISNTIIRIEAEKPSKYLAYISEIQQFIGKNENLDNVTKIILDAKINNNTKSLLNATEYDEQKIKSLYENLVKNGMIDDMKRKFLDLTDDIQKNKEYRKILKKNEMNLEIVNMLSTIVNMEREIQNYDLKIESLEISISELDKKISEIQGLMEMLENKIKHVSNETNSFEVARKMLKVIDEFKRIYSRRTQKEVATLAYKKFKEITSKSDYINGIDIDDEFNVTVLDNRNNNMPIELFSAGEKQLLVSSLIYAIVKKANRKVPFVFDTPLARLDYDNRFLFVNYIMRDISDQILILSTNSEIVGKTKEIIEDRISKTLLLNYSEIKSKTSVTDEYFQNEVKI